jgi:hypothetical protein
MGHIRGHGVTRLLVYCDALNCNHSATIDGAPFPDDLVLLELDRRMVCSRCGHVGADVRPDWSQHTNAPKPGGAHRR